MPKHVPVMVEKCLELLSLGISTSDNPYMIDGTLGLGGHSKVCLETFPQLHILGIDRDESALKIACARLNQYRERLHPVHTTYDQVAKVAKKFSPEGKVQAILMDLGVSSMQLDEDERGFSYSRNTYLDMRMDQSRGLKAADILAEKTAEEIAEILWKYGDEKFSRRISEAIVREREKTPVEYSAQLVEIIERVIPAPARRSGGHPAKRTFQALRVAVNQELEILQRAIPQALEALAVGGVLVVESYQSLEDRIVKQIFQAVTDSGSSLYPLPEKEQNFSLLTRKAIMAEPEEIALNSRAKPVRIRAIQRKK